MVTLTAEIYPPVKQVKNRKIFAFGLVKVKLSSGSHQNKQADDLSVLGMVVIEDQNQSTDENL